MGAVRKIAKIAAPLAVGLIPGIGPLGAAALGAGAGALGGGGLKGALLGGIGAGVGNALGAGSLFGTKAGTALSGGLQGPTQGSGLLGSLTRGLSGGGSGISLNTVGNIASGINSLRTQNEVEDELLRAQGRASEAYSPFYNAGVTATNQLSDRLSSGFNPGDLTQDPGYQFRLAEGNKALDRRFSAAGALDSGAALKAAQQYGQGLADQTYNDAYQRWLQQNSQLSGVGGSGLNAAGGLAGIYDRTGDISANASLARSNLINSSLSDLLSGSGARRVIGLDINGDPIYADA